MGRNTREGRNGETFLFREECGDPGSPLQWGGLRQGMKVSEGRCGNKSEAKPVPGQTCPIEPQKDLAYDGNERNKEMGPPPADFIALARSR